MAWPKSSRFAGFLVEEAKMRQKTRQEKIVKNAPQAQEPLFDQKTFFAINNALNLYESRRLKILLDKPEGQKAAFHGRFQKGETALQIALKNHGYPDYRVEYFWENRTKGLKTRKRP